MLGWKWPTQPFTHLIYSLLAPPSAQITLDDYTGPPQPLNIIPIHFLRRALLVFPRFEAIVRDFRPLITFPLARLRGLSLPSRICTSPSSVLNLLKPKITVLIISYCSANFWARKASRESSKFLLSSFLLPTRSGEQTLSLKFIFFDASCFFRPLNRVLMLTENRNICS